MLASIDIPTIRISDDHTKLIFLVDLEHTEKPLLGVKDLNSNRILEFIPQALSAEWASDAKSFYYTVPDDQNRPHIVKKHVLGTSHEKDEVIHSENDGAFYVELTITKDKKYMLINSNSKTTSEIYAIDRVTNTKLHTVSKQANVRYYLEHNRGNFYIVTNHNSPDFKVIRVPVGQPLHKSEEFVSGEDGRCIEEIDMFENHLVIYTRHNGIPNITIFDLRTSQQTKLKFPNEDEVFSIKPGVNIEYSHPKVRMHYSSPTILEATYDYDLNTSKLNIIHTKTIQGRYNPKDLLAKRVQVPSHDGVEIPLTLFHRRDIELNRK